MNTIAVDIGYGRTKVVTSSKTAIFPSHLVTFKQSSGLEVLKKTDFVEVDGTKYYVGEKAVSEGSPRSLIGDTFHGSKEWKALLAYSLYSFRDFFKEGNEHRLVLGLPFSQFNNQRRLAIKEAAKDIKCLINNESYHFPFTDVYTLPQGAGAIMEHIGDEDGGITAIVDIGFYTLDLVVFVDAEFSLSKSTSLNYGVEHLYKDVGKLLTADYNITYDVNRIEKVVRSGKITFKGSEIDLREPIASHIYYYSTEMMNKLQEQWQDVLNDANKIIFIGGGAEIVRSTLPKQSNFSIPENPSLANALGFHKYGENKK
jgi:plasmid segregation protein ParM